MGQGAWVKGQGRQPNSAEKVLPGPWTPAQDPNNEEGGFAMKQSAIVTCLLVTLVMFLFMMLAPTAQAQQKTITLNYSIFSPATHKTSVLADEWLKRWRSAPMAWSRPPCSTEAPSHPDAGIRRGGEGLSDIAQGVFSYHRGRFP